MSQYARPFVEAVHWIERQLGSATESGDDRRLQTITLTMEVPAGGSDALSLRAYTLVLSDALTTFAESSPWFQPIRTRHGRLGRMQTTRSDVLGLGGLDYGWQNATPHAHLLVYGEVVGLAKIRRLWAEALRRAWDRAAAGKLIRKRLGIPRTLFAALRPRSGRPARVEVQVRPLGENPLRTVRRYVRYLAKPLCEKVTSPWAQKRAALIEIALAWVHRIRAWGRAHGWTELLPGEERAVRNGSEEPAGLRGDEAPCDVEQRSPGDPPTGAGAGSASGARNGTSGGPAVRRTLDRVRAGIHFAWATIANRCRGVMARMARLVRARAAPQERSVS